MAHGHTNQGQINKKKGCVSGVKTTPFQEADRYLEDRMQAQKMHKLLFFQKPPQKHHHGHYPGQSA